MPSRRVLAAVLGLAVLSVSIASLAAAAPSPGALSPADKVKKVVFLMLENRSFQAMMALLKAKNPEITGCLPGSDEPRCTNPFDPSDPSSEVYKVGDQAVYIQPADPSHSVQSTTEQLFGEGPATGTPSNDGFIINYRKHSPANATSNGTEIMQCFSPSALPVMSALASEFMLFDQWFAGVPGPTFVNRAFAQAGSSDGMGKNDVLRLAEGLPLKTIMQQVEEAGKEWGVYFSDFPTSFMFNHTRQWSDLQRFQPISKFYDDVKNGTLPSFSWLEPRYLDLHPLWTASDQHPDHDVAEGEQLIKSVYEALRAADSWNETMFVLTYDEHGGFFDPVAPGACPSPDGKVSTDPPFDFKRLGIRVPTIVMSPYTPKGAVEHVPANWTEGKGHYEHASIPATVRNLLAPSQGPLTARDAWAAPFDEVALSLDTPRTDTPKTLPDAPSHRVYGSLPPPDGRMPCTELQRTCAQMVAGMNGESLTDFQLDLMSERQCGLHMIDNVNKFFGREVVKLPEYVR